MGIRGSVHKCICRDNKDYNGVRCKIKSTPNTLENLEKIMPMNREIYKLLVKCYEEKDF